MKKATFLFAALLTLGGASVFTACEENNTYILVEGIPSDEEASPNPTVTPEEINTVLPNFNYSVSTVSGYSVIRFDMTGVQDPYTKDWLRLYGPDNSRQNMWISIDDVPKGFTVINTIDEAGNQTNPAVDLVFLVDNSTSMSEEADAIYRDIVEWSEQLSRTLDVRFGCVGYGGFVSGAINLTSAAELKDWLENKTWRSTTEGVWRTRDFYGKDSLRLAEAAADPNYRVVGSSYDFKSWGDPDDYECGVMALRYANDHFSFRSGANRVYVNLTDEPNQPGSKRDLFSTEWVKNNWTSTQGTIHTVYTRSASYADSYMNNVDENYPWDLSIYTNGTMLFTNSSFKDKDGNLVKLSDLPVSGALQNSYIIRLTNVEDLFDGLSHNVHITIKSNSANGEILADKTFPFTFTR